MLLGHYDRLAVDTELKRFLKQRCPDQELTTAAMRQAYDEWAPYQFLAYWFELWQGYSSVHGPADTWHFDDQGRRITTQPGGSSG